MRLVTGGGLWLLLVIGGDLWLLLVIAFYRKSGDFIMYSFDVNDNGGVCSYH